VLQVGPHDGCNETITPADDVGYIPRAAAAIAKRLAEARYVNPEASLIHTEARPNLRDQVFLADDLASAFDQHDQNIEGAAPHPHRAIRCLEQPLHGQQPKRPKSRGTARPDIFCLHIGAPSPLVPADKVLI
jgi:hypothetical protein